MSSLTPEERRRHYEEEKEREKALYVDWLQRNAGKLDKSYRISTPSDGNGSRHPARGRSSASVEASRRRTLVMAGAMLGMAAVFYYITYLLWPK